MYNLAPSPLRAPARRESCTSGVSPWNVLCVRDLSIMTFFWLKKRAVSKNSNTSYKILILVIGQYSNIAIKAVGKLTCQLPITGSTPS